MVARYNAWDLIILSIQCKAYFDFLISTHFATAHRTEGISTQTATDLWKCYKVIHPEHPHKFKDLREFTKWELQARHDLEDMMHFYTLVNHRIKHSGDKYEFYYDWWRVFFWWMTDAMNTYYEEIPTIHQPYVRKPKWDAIWESLDQLYGFVAPKTPAERLKQLIAHPTVALLKLDPAHMAQKSVEHV